MERERKEKAKGRKEKAKGRKEKAKGRKETSPTKERKESSPTKERKERSIMDSDYAKSISCHICLTRDHPSFVCPYRLKYPAGAVVGRFARIRCLCCGKVMPHRGRPGIDWEARVDLKPSFSYPSVEEELMELNKASTSEAAVDGTGKIDGGYQFEKGTEIRV